MLRNTRRNERVTKEKRKTLGFPYIKRGRQDLTRGRNQEFFYFIFFLFFAVVECKKEGRRIGAIWKKQEEEEVTE